MRVGWGRGSSQNGRRADFRISATTQLPDGRRTDNFELFTKVIVTLKAGALLAKCKPLCTVYVVYNLYTV